MRLRSFHRFLSDESGATAIEYALLGTLIAVALAATFAVVGDSVNAMFSGGTDRAGGIIAEQTAKIPR
ncbi:MAG: Flp family type IVb pilin [Phyllobacteriaceae bacterium]|nr:Flp family type IVb pilin [Phyllobacteriaceae bacterium]